MSVLEIISAVFLLGGAIFCVIGGIGVVRLPDFYTRCHGAGVTDTAGAAGILVGLMFIAQPLVIVKLVTILVFLWLTSAASSHALGKAAFASGLRVDDEPIDWTTGLSAHPPAMSDEELAAEESE